MDRHLYPWIILYIWKTRNDKLFREIDKDLLKLIKYAERECQAWFTANEPTSDLVQTQVATSQALRFEKICFLDGSWTSTSIFNGCGWMLLDNMGRTQLMRIQNQRQRESALHTELKAIC